MCQFDTFCLGADYTFFNEFSNSCRIFSNEFFNIRRNFSNEFSLRFTVHKVVVHNFVDCWSSRYFIIFAVYGTSEIYA